MGKIKKIAICVLFLSGALVLGAQDVVEAIVAIVNDDIISLSQYKQQYELFVQMLRQQVGDEELSEKRKQVEQELLNSMVTDLLLLQEARKKGLNVAEQLKMYIEKIRKENNLETDDQLKRALLQQGIDFDDWRHQMEESLLKQNVIFSEVSRNIAIDDSEIVSYYKQHPDEFTELPQFTLRAIHLSVDLNSEEGAQAKMREIDEKMAAGEDFAGLAGQYSEGPEKESQGDLGSFKKGELEKSLEQAVENLNVGEMAPWVKTGNGWYLLRLEDKKESRIRAFEEVRKEIEDKLYEEQNEKKLREFLDKLKEQSYIKILIPNPLEYRVSGL